MRLLRSSRAAPARPSRRARRAGPRPVPKQPIDWPALEREGVTLLRDYLRVNSTNPPGNELEAARFLRDFLAKEGIEAQILDTTELGAGRANLYARVKGNGSKKAIALVHHMDVVPATASYWSVPPFSGDAPRRLHLRTRRARHEGGGDRAADGGGRAQAQRRARSRATSSSSPTRTRSWASTGALTFADKHADLLRDVEFLFTEGGSNSVRNDTARFRGVGVSEKRTFWQRLTVTRHAVARLASHEGQPGAATRRRARPARTLRDAAARHAGRGPLLPRHQPQLPGTSRASGCRTCRAALDDPRAREWILCDVYWNAILRNTISLTGLQGSNKTNVIPPEASRGGRHPAAARPGPGLRCSPRSRRVVADTAVKFSPLIVPKAPFESPTNTDFFRAVERVVARARSGRVRHEHDAHGCDRSAHVSQARHPGLRCGSVPHESTRRTSAASTATTSGSASPASCRESDSCSTSCATCSEACEHPHRCCIGCTVLLHASHTATLVAPP